MPHKTVTATIQKTKKDSISPQGPLEIWWATGISTWLTCGDITRKTLSWTQEGSLFTPISNKGQNSTVQKLFVQVYL